MVSPASYIATYYRVHMYHLACYSVVVPVGIEPTLGTYRVRKGYKSFDTSNYMTGLKWWTGRASNPPHGACKALSPSRNMPAHKIKTPLA